MTPGYLANKKYRKKYPDKRKAERHRYYQRTAGPEKNHNHQALWTLHELDLLSIPSLTDRALHKLIGRSVAAIQNKRWQIKKEISS